MNTTRSTVASEGWLLLAAAIWGFAFVAQRAGMEYLGPFTFNGLRFALGALSLVPVLWWCRRPGTASVTRRLAYGAVTGAVLFAAVSLQQIGIVHTTAGKAGFITGLYVVMVPIIGVLRRQRVTRGALLGIALAVPGMYLLAVREDLSIGAGDLVVLVGAVFWAVHVQVIDAVNKTMDALELAFLQFVVCAILSGSAGVWLEPVTLPAIRSALVPLLYGGVASVGIAYTLQVVAQKRVPPAHAAIILSMESVFAVMGGWMMLGETVSWLALCGCALMLAGILSVQVVNKQSVSAHCKS